jgi:mannosyltransferase OCH1-like enzyme
MDWVIGWRAMHGAWEIRLWHEDDLRALPLRNRALLELYLSRKNWVGAADVARVEVLLTCGGVYTDIDSEPLRPLDDAPFMSAGFFAAYTLPLAGHPGRVGNGTMGAVRGHPVLEDYAATMRRAKRLTPVWNTIGGTMLTQVLARHRTSDVLILPTGTFYAEGRRGARANDGATAYVRHFWAGSPDPVVAYP